MYEYKVVRYCNKAAVVPKMARAHRKDGRAQCSTHGEVSTLRNGDIIRETSN